MRRFVVLGACLTALLGGGLPAPAALAAVTNVDFPTQPGWHNPVSDPQYNNWDFGTCWNGYQDGAVAHLGADSQGTARAGSGVEPLANGKVIGIGGEAAGWGGSLGSAITVLHQSSGGPFVALYGHVDPNPGLQAGDPVTFGQAFAALHYQEYNRHDNTHLHLGIRPLAPGEAPSSIGFWGSADCVKDPSRPDDPATADHHGFVDPIPWLQSQKPASSVDVALIIDSSGSMAWNDPSDLRKSGARIFVNAALSGDYIGILDFDDRVRVAGPLARIPDGRGGLLAAIDTIDSNGGTNIGPAVQAACDMLQASPSTNSKAAVLLTDGQGSFLDQHLCFKDHGWPVYTVGLSTGAADALLRRIASETGGTYSYLESASQLQALFLQLHGQVSGGQVLQQATTHLDLSGLFDLQIVVPPASASLSFLATWPGSTVDQTATSPSGRSITCETEAPDVTCDQGSTYELINVLDPEPGQWDLRVFGTDLPPGGEPVTSIVVAVPDAPTSNLAPALTASAVGQQAQHSDSITPIDFVGSDPDGAAASLAMGSTWTVDGGSPQPGLPAGLGLSPGGCDQASCIWTMSGQPGVPSGTYTVTLQVTDAGGESASAATTIEVAAEDVTIAFAPDNPIAVSVAESGGNSPAINLTALVAETLPDQASGTPAPGDVSRADLSMALQPVGGGTPVLGTCALGSASGAGYDAQLKVTCSFHDVAVNAYTVSAGVANGYYSGSGEDVLVVYDPSLGFTTGGGWFAWPGTLEKTTFGFTMKYNNKATSVQGNFLLVRHLADGTSYRIKSNSLYGLATGSSADVDWASFAGRATYQEPSWEDPTGGYEFVAYVTDQAAGDAAWLEVHDKKGKVVAVMSMRRPASTGAAPLGGGNIVVPH